MGLRLPHTATLRRSAFFLEACLDRCRARCSRCKASRNPLWSALRRPRREACKAAYLLSRCKANAETAECCEGLRSLEIFGEDTWARTATQWLSRPQALLRGEESG